MAKSFSVYNFITISIIFCTIPLGEVSQFFPHYTDAAFYNLFPFSNDKIQFAWYYFFLMRCITWILIMLAVLRIAVYTEPMIYRTCKVYLFYRIADLCAFMLFKSAAPLYTIVYAAVTIYAIYQYVKYKQDEKTDYTW